jgi:hypothetical protein
LTTSKGVTGEDEQEDFNDEEVHLLVNAVSVEPVAAATSFAWNGSIL